VAAFRSMGNNKYNMQLKYSKNQLNLPTNNQNTAFTVTELQNFS
jgi:hypothetical protein